ncbi:MAG TPA: CBS domain-containing protein [Candidatus Deferrimicrobium sp.]|nr:CBS domain-containing protein [Candidatus Deferrimicrobium sp.]
MLTVRDVMSRPALTVQPDTPLKDVARLLIKHRISGLPVVDDAGHILGVISEADLLLKEQGPSNVHHRRLSRILGESSETRTQLAKLSATSAGDAMTVPAVTIGADRPIAEAAALMTSRGINRLPVVEDGVLAGVVSRADLVRAYVRSDEELANVVRDEVLYRTMWLNPALFDVAVHDGIVRISGSVGRRSTAEMIARVTSLVPGVIDVVSEVNWETDDSDFVAPAPDLVSAYTDRR